MSSNGVLCCINMYYFRQEVQICASKACNSYIGIRLKLYAIEVMKTTPYFRIIIL